jgi:regulator of sigma E protease
MDSMTQFVQGAGDWIALIVLLGLSIFVHELGHFLAARRFGMIVDTFSIGFGPAIWKRKVGDTTYKIGCLPLGGYVALPQLDPSGMSKVQGGADKESRELPFVSPWKRIAVCAAGPFGNVILAVVLAWIVYLGPEVPQDTSMPGTMIGSVETNSAAYAAGVRPGDEIAAVNGRPVRTWHDFSVECVLGGGPSNQVVLTLRSPAGRRDVTVPTEKTEIGIQAVKGVERGATCVMDYVVPGGNAEKAGLRRGDTVKTVDGTAVVGVDHFIRLINGRAGTEVEVAVEREGELMTFAVTPRHDAALGRDVIGVRLGSLEQATLPWMVHREPWAQIRYDAMGIFRLLGALVTPREAKQATEGLGGIVMIVATLWMSIQVSWMNGIGFLRFLNVNLALLNFLPIPVLDGGHIMFFLWEGITKRRVHPRVVSILVNTMAVLLIAAVLFLNLRDVVRLNQWMPLLRKPPPAEAVVTNAPPSTTNPAPETAPAAP